jgi:hypothetical protein
MCCRNNTQSPPKVLVSSSLIYRCVNRCNSVPVHTCVDEGIRLACPACLRASCVHACVDKGILHTVCVSRLRVIEGVLHACGHRGCTLTRASCIWCMRRGCVSTRHGVFCVHVRVEAAQGILQVHMWRLWEEHAEGECVEGGVLKGALKGSKSNGSTSRGKGECIEGFCVEG